MKDVEYFWREYNALSSDIFKILDKQFVVFSPEWVAAKKYAAFRIFGCYLDELGRRSLDSLVEEVRFEHHILASGILSELSRKGIVLEVATHVLGKVGVGGVLGVFEKIKGEGLSDAESLRLACSFVDRFCL